MLTNKKIVVIYHKNCPDGFGAAWAAWKKFGSKAEYIGLSHPAVILKEIKGREVYMLDFCYSEEIMQKAVKEAARLVVIDHHASQQKAVKYSNERVFKMNHSGSVLSWGYFFPKKKAPKLLRYIEDGDLWKFSLKGTEEYLSFIGTQKFDFKIWDKLVKDFENTDKRKSFYEKGASIVAFSKRSIKDLSSSAEWVNFDNRRCLAVNSPLYVSEVGYALALEAKGVGIVWHKKRDKLKVSLRSNGKMDVSKVALKYGGGGHKAAAAFSIKITGRALEFPWKLISK
jgi:oligoribonuclease NrnB/cAMP/cGMP phosphodiesterase (DHH superfamily)